MYLPPYEALLQYIIARQRMGYQPTSQGQMYMGQNNQLAPPPPRPTPGVYMGQVDSAEAPPYPQTRGSFYAGSLEGTPAEAPANPRIYMGQNTEAPPSWGMQPTFRGKMYMGPALSAAEELQLGFGGR